MKCSITRVILHKESPQARQNQFYRVFFFFYPSICLLRKICLDLLFLLLLFLISKFFCFCEENTQLCVMSVYVCRHMCKWWLGGMGVDAWENTVSMNTSIFKRFFNHAFPHITFFLWHQNDNSICWIFNSNISVQSQ